MVQQREGRILTVTPENYQQIMLAVLRTNNAGNLKLLSIRAGEAGIADPKVIDKLTDNQWMAMLHKLRAVHPELTEDERESSKEWCFKNGVYPGGNSEFDESV
jgi:hypothetical protein